MIWSKIIDIKNINEIVEESRSKKILIFKHSTRCSISVSALNRLERNWKQDDGLKLKPYFLDLLNYRDISNQIANTFGVDHQSPQVLIIENGNCTFNQSHLDINYEDIF